MPYVLGIDGGGSKTAAAVSNGISVFSSHAQKGCNLNACSPDEARIALALAIEGALSAAEINCREVSSVCAGIAGAASPEVAGKLAELLAELLPRAAVRVVGDTVIAMEAAFNGGPGVVCISGTGSVAFGRNDRGEVTRAGGWGRMVSDEGSGHWIGQRAVSKCLRAMDQGRSSQLVTGIMKHWRIVTREQLVQRCHRDPLPNFAELFPIVLAVAESGDPIASEILNAAALELARITQVVLRRLWTGRSIQQVAITGSVFANSARVRHVYGNVLHADRPEVLIRLCKHQPVEGALQMAWKALSGNNGGLAKVIAS
jgi:N-acetylglucosamine kinase-like BadF-type ATPase